MFSYLKAKKLVFVRVVDSLTSLDIVIPDYKLWKANKVEKLFIDKKKNLLLK